MKQKVLTMIGFVFCIVTLLPGIAFANDNTTEATEFTPELAVQSAQSFADSAYSEEELIAFNPMIFFDEEGKAIGYIVEFKHDDSPFGYIIFDNTDPSLISEFVIEEGVTNPFINEENPNTIAARTYTSPDQAIVKTGPYCYTSVDLKTRNSISNYGEINSLDDSVINTLEKNPSTRSVDPSTWDDIFVNVVPGQYNIASTKWITPFIGYSQKDIKDATGGYYACAIVALIDCAKYYDPNFSSQSLKTTYDALFNATDSWYEGYQGYTYTTTIAPGFKEYMQSRGVSIKATAKDNPTWNDYYSSVNSWNMSTFDCGIKEYNGERSGHTMSVQGYTILDPLPSGNIVYTLGVHDGWNTFARYVNFNYSNYMDKHGSFFS